MYLLINQLGELGELDKVGKYFQLKKSPHNVSIMIYIIYIMLSWEVGVHQDTFFCMLNDQKSWTPFPTSQLLVFLDHKLLIISNLLSWKYFPTYFQPNSIFQLCEV